MASRDDIDEAVRAMLQAGTCKEVGLCTIPNTPTLPYAIVYPIGAGIDEGSWAKPGEDRSFNYQVKCVGADARQAGWMSSKVCAVMIDRTEADEYEYPLAITGAAVHWRATDALGAIVPSGEKLYESNDSYVIRIGA